MQIDQVALRFEEVTVSMIYRFAKSIVKHGYIQIQADHTLFIKFSSIGKLAILIIYVDDIILTGDDFEEILKLKTLFAS